MAITQIRGLQVRDGSIQTVDIDTSTPGKALITRVIPGDGISVISTGADVGTGEVTISYGYHHVQDIASLVWSIEHSLNKFPSVVTIDSEGTEIEGSITYSINSLIVTFSQSVSGQAYLS